MIICRKKNNFHGHCVNKLSLLHKKDNHIFVVLEIDYMNLLIIRTNTFFFFGLKITTHASMRYIKMIIYCV